MLRWLVIRAFGAPKPLDAYHCDNDVVSMTTHAQRTANEPDSLSDSCTCSIIHRASIRNIHWCFQLLQASFGGLCQVQLWGKIALPTASRFQLTTFETAFEPFRKGHTWKVAMLFGRHTLPQRLLAEGVLRRATKLVLGLKDLDYSERLECMD